MQIDIWSDVVCPWCYLGAVRLDAALDEVGRDGVDVRWRAFQLNPSAPPAPTDLRSALESKYGPGSFDTMTQRLVDLGAAAGIDYRFDRALSINTAQAHRVIAWARSQGDGAQTSIVRRLFRSYFTDGEDLSSDEVLLRLVGDVGLDAGAAELMLAGEDHRDDVVEDQRLARERGITGVPAFVVDDQWMIPGAQEVDRLVQMLQRARVESESAR